MGGGPFRWGDKTGKRRASRYREENIKTPEKRETEI